MVSGVVPITSISRTTSPLGIRFHPSAAEVAAGNSSDIDVSQFLCAESCIDITAVGTQASTDIIIEGKDETSGKYRAIHSYNATGIATDWLTITTLTFILVRVRWVINTPGVGPSITFSAALQGKS